MKLYHHLNSQILTWISLPFDQRGQGSISWFESSNLWFLFSSFERGKRKGIIFVMILRISFDLPSLTWRDDMSRKNVSGSCISNYNFAPDHIYRLLENFPWIPIKNWDFYSVERKSLIRPRQWNEQFFTACIFLYCNTLVCYHLCPRLS